MGLLSDFLAQVSAVQTVWMPFLLAVAIAGIAIWKLVQREYSVRLTNAASDISSLERRLRDYETKLGGASADEAKARIEALEKRIDSVEPKKVSVSQRHAMAAALEGLEGSVAIMSDAQSPDSKRISDGIAAALQSAGWRARIGASLGVSVKAPSGIFFTIPDPANPDATQRALMRALEIGGFRFDLRPGPQRGVIAELLITDPAE